jgi:hypothetical protein
VGGDIHRIGGGSVENLLPKPRELTLDPPGISVLRSATPGEAARQMRRVFPNARGLHDLSRTVGSTTVEAIREAGFEVLEDPTTNFTNHVRIIHPDGASGFSAENLIRLSATFHDTTGH